MDDLGAASVRTERWHLNNLVLEIPNNWKGEDFEADSVERTELGVHHFFYFSPAISFAEAIEKVRNWIPDENPTNLTHYLKEKLLLVSF